MKYFQPTTNKMVTTGYLGLSDESIKLPTTSDNSLNLTLNYFNKLKFWAKFNGRFLKADMVYFHNNTINLYIVFEWNGRNFV